MGETLSSKVRSAMAGAEARVSHRLMYPPPYLFDDPFVLALMGSDNWEAMAAESKALVREPMLRRARSGVVLRFRYSEDRLALGRYTQYVILGAGLDTFAWRHRELVPPLRVFEVDHPQAQEWKRRRVEALGLPTIEGHVLAPVDFETETPLEGLAEAGFDSSRPTLFQCVGVMMYLTRDAVEATLRTVATCAAGSGIVFSYNPDPSLLDDDGREFLASVSKRVEKMGEPLKSFFADVESLIRSCGLDIADHPTGDEMFARYGFRPLTVERLVAARVL